MQLSVTAQCLAVCLVWLCRCYLEQTSSEEKQAPALADGNETAHAATLPTCTSDNCTGILFWHHPSCPISQFVFVWVILCKLSIAQLHDWPLRDSTV